MTHRATEHFPHLLFLLLLCGSLFSIFSAQAVEEPSITEARAEQIKKQKELEEEKAALDAKIKAYNKIIELKNRQGSLFADQIEVLQAQAAKLEIEIQANTEKLSDIEGSLKSVEERVSEKTRYITREKQLLAEVIREYHAGLSDSTNIVFSYDDDTNGFFSKREDWATETGERIRQLLSDLESTKKSLTEEQDLLRKKREEIDALKMQLSERNEYLESTKNNKAYLLTKTQAEVKKYDSLVDDLQKQREELDSEIADLEAGKIGEIAGMPSCKKGLLDYPLKKFSISQGYGKTSFSKTAYASGKHNGIDFANSSGTAILAANDGKVVGTGNLGQVAYGKWVAIDHGNGIVTLYGHMSSISVSRGAKVLQGETIGKVGSTGFSTGPHVHFTVYAARSFEIISSYKTKSGRTVKGLPTGAPVNPNCYLP